MTSKDDLEIAVNRYESYIKADPDNHLLWLELGDLYHRLSRFEDALASFEKTLALLPGLPAARSRVALVHISQHRFEQAEGELRQLVNEGHTEPELFHNLGLALYYQERWEDAKEYFTAADSSGLKAPSNFAYLARCLHHAGDMKQAIAVCQQWTASTDDPASLGYLSLLYFENEDRAEASEFAARALQNDPSNIDAAIVVGTLAMEQQDVATARVHFSSVLEKEPQSGRAWLGLGMAHLYNQEHTQGIKALEEAQKRMPKHSGTIVALGWAKLSQQDAKGAEQSFRESVKVDSTFAEAHGGLAAALLFQNRREAAKEEMKTSFRLDKNNFGGLYTKSILLKLEGSGELATRLVAGALEQTPPGGNKPLVEYVRTFAQQKNSSRS